MSRSTRSKQAALVGLRSWGEEAASLARVVDRTTYYGFTDAEKEYWTDRLTAALDRDRRMMMASDGDD